MATINQSTMERLRELIEKYGIPENIDANSTLLQIFLYCMQRNPKIDTDPTKQFLDAKTDLKKIRAISQKYAEYASKIRSKKDLHGEDAVYTYAPSDIGAITAALNRAAAMVDAVGAGHIFKESEMNDPLFQAIGFQVGEGEHTDNFVGPDDVLPKTFQTIKFNQLGRLPYKQWPRQKLVSANAEGELCFCPEDSIFPDNLPLYAMYFDGKTEDNLLVWEGDNFPGAVLNDQYVTINAELLNFDFAGADPSDAFVRTGCDKDVAPSPRKDGKYEVTRDEAYLKWEEMQTGEIIKEGDWEIRQKCTYYFVVQGGLGVRAGCDFDPTYMPTLKPLTKASGCNPNWQFFIGAGSHRPYQTKWYTTYAVAKAHWDSLPEPGQASQTILGGPAYYYCELPTNFVGPDYEHRTHACMMTVNVAPTTEIYDGRASNDGRYYDQMRLMAFNAATFNSTKNWIISHHFERWTRDYDYAELNLNILDFLDGKWGTGKTKNADSLEAMLVKGCKTVEKQKYGAYMSLFNARLDSEARLEQLFAGVGNRSRAMEQLYELYLVKFMLQRILFGHLHRCA